MDKARTLQRVNQTLIGPLWPFDTELSPLSAGQGRASRYAFHAVKQIWALQHSTALPSSAALSLIHALRTTVESLSVSREVHAWVTLIDAQQSMLKGDALLASQLLAELMARDDISLDARAGVVCVAFHAALLNVSPWQRGAAQELGRTEALNLAMAEARQWRQGLLDRRHECNPRMQAQLLRVGAVMDALAGLELERPVWLQMASDMARPAPSMERAYSQLACAWVFLAEQRNHRATVAFEAALATAEALGWRLGQWWAAYELDVLRHPLDRHDIRLNRLPKHLMDWSETALPRDTSVEAAPPDSASRLDIAKRYIQANLARRISILEVASVCQVSPRTLTQDFHAGEGKTPLEYINELKVHRAGDWLAQGRSLREVATAVGFETVLGFTKAYMRVHGVPPPGLGVD